MTPTARLTRSSGISMSCVNDAAENLKTALGGSPYVVTEEYTDVDCTQLMLTRAFLADGECHVAHEDDGRTWSMTTTVGSDGTVAVLGTDNECGGPNPYYHLDTVSKSDLNTGKCIVIPDSDGGNQSYSAKSYFVDPSTPAPPDTTTSITDSSVSSTDDGTTTLGSDSPGSSTSNDTTTSSTDTSSSSANTTAATSTPAATNATVWSSGTSRASNLLAVSLVLSASSVALGATIL